MGDHTIATDFPHGNCKPGSTAKFIRTCPSVLAELSVLSDLPSNVYKQAVAKMTKSESPELQASCIPRNKTQITNLQCRQRQKHRLTHDALYNLHELAYDIDGFVKVITTYPSLIVVCGLFSLLTELDLTLQLDFSRHSQLLSYDTTFQLGDFYVSPLLFRHTIFNSLPVIPALFLIHERKSQQVHERFMQCLSELVPTLYIVKGREKIPFVTDEECAINQVK